jgi:hypothetical protein
MKTGVVLILIFFFISCSDTIETLKVVQTPNQKSDEVNILDIGCIVTYETLENGEEINRVFGKEKVRHGHWITYVLIVPKGSTTNKMVRAKMEEGFYHWNKKVGFWKIYNQDGTVRDSIEYKNGVAMSYEL